jgi:hypothetical protein
MGCLLSLFRFGTYVVKEREFIVFSLNLFRK